MFWTVAKGMRQIVRWQRRRRGPLRPSWSDDYETLAFILRSYTSRSLKLPLSVQRRAAHGFFEKSPVLRETRIERGFASAVPYAWFHQEGADPDAVLLYFHGGGYSLGSIDSHSELVARICKAAGVPGFSVGYRLAPEHRYPAQLHDAVAAYRHLLDEGYDPKRIVVGGESAGGGLTLSLLIALRDSGTPLPKAAFVISPWLDLEARSASMQANRPYDFINAELLQAFSARFVEPHQLRDPLAAPIHADLRGLPELLIHAGGAEVLLDDSKRLAAELVRYEVPHELVVYDDMIHAFHVFAPIVAEGQRAIEAIGDYVRRQIVAR